MDFRWVPVLSVALFFAMLICIQVGYWIGRKQVKKEPEQARVGTAVITGAVITILGLMLGFSLAASETRFDRRRQMIIEEANAIGTAYLRLDLLPASEQHGLRDLVAKYLDTRLEAYASAPDVEKAMKKAAEASAISAQIWSHAQKACRKDARVSTEVLVLSAINNMIDIATARTAALLQHLPSLIVALICGISLLCSIMIGYRSSPGKKIKLFSGILFATIVAGTFYVIMDLEFPRLGLIRLENEDRVLIDLQKNLRKRKAIAHQEGQIEVQTIVTHQHAGALTTERCGP